MNDEDFSCEIQSMEEILHQLRLVVYQFIPFFARLNISAGGDRRISEPSTVGTFSPSFHGCSNMDPWVPPDVGLVISPRFYGELEGSSPGRLTL